MCTVELLLERGVNPNPSVDSVWYFPLATAAFRGNSEHVEKLVMRGATIDFTGAMKGTPLLISMVKKHTETALLLIEKGADPFIQCNFKYSETDEVTKKTTETLYETTPFKLAITTDGFELTVAMINCHYSSPVHIASGLDVALKNKKERIAIALVDALHKKSFNLDKPLCSGNSPAFLCVINNLHRCLKKLEAANANIWKVEKDTSESPLQKAIDKGSYGCITVFTESPCFKPENCMTELNGAIQKGLCEPVFRLLRSGVPLTTKRNESLSLAVNSKNDGIISLVIMRVRKLGVQAQVLKTCTVEKVSGFQLLEKHAPQFLQMLLPDERASTDEEFDVLTDDPKLGIQLSEQKKNDKEDTKL